MKLVIAALAVLLSAVGAKADSGALKVSGTWDYLVSGQQFEVSLSYQLSEPSYLATVSDITFSSNGLFGQFALFNDSPLDMEWSNGNGTAGVVVSAEIESFTPGGPLQVYLIVPGNPGDPLLPFSATGPGIVAAPEPGTCELLIAGMVALIALSQTRAEARTR